MRCSVMNQIREKKKKKSRRSKRFQCDVMIESIPYRTTAAPSHACGIAVGEKEKKKKKDSQLRIHQQTRKFKFVM